MCLLLCLSGCCNAPSNIEKHTYFLQAPFNVANIAELQEKISPAINNIIEEEAELKSEKDLPLFFFKKHAAITLYYINDMFANAEPILFESLESLTSFSRPHNITISSKVGFFGEQKEDRMALLDLAVEVNDPKKELSLLNKAAKIMVHATDEKYKNNYNIAMYDRAKSEQYSFFPHLSIGHLRANYIKHLINDASKAEQIIERIKQRIIEEVAKILTEISLENKKITFDTLGIYDLKKRVYVKEYSFRK